MKLLKKIIKRIAQIGLIIYVIICALLFFYQESLIFAPSKLPADFVFNFPSPFEELKIKAKDDSTLSGLLFKTDYVQDSVISPKGLVFYLHGNAGCLASWGGVADVYTSRGYDVFLLDYRGYGKSEGTISSENQFYADVQAAYNVLKKRYAQDKIIILGYSLGTGAATILASNNKPKHLILQAPYYSLTDMMKQHYPFAPTFLLKYRFDVRLFLPKVKAPVTVFHGNNDAIIYYGSSLKLKEHFKASDQLITLEGGRHNGMSSNPDYLTELDKLLAH